MSFQEKCISLSPLSPSSYYSIIIVSYKETGGCLLGVSYVSFLTRSLNIVTQGRHRETVGDRGGVSLNLPGKIMELGKGDRGDTYCTKLNQKRKNR
jgi:hypothetical protein